MEKLGKLLQCARKARGLTQAEVAEMMGFKSRTTIVAIEKGDRSVSESELQKLAEIYGKCAEDFQELEVIVEDFAPPTLISDIEMVYMEKLQQLALNYFELEKLTQSFWRVWTPSPLKNDYPNTGIVKAIAEKERQNLGLGTATLRGQMRKVLEYVDTHSLNQRLYRAILAS